MSEEKKDPPELEEWTKWLTEDWAHMGLLVAIAGFIILLIIVLWRR